jgi:hypothetical protein
MTPAELAARESKPIALAWIDAAIAALQNHTTSLLAGKGGSPLVRSALRTSFSLREEPLESLYVVVVIAMFVRARDVIVKSNEYFHDVSEDEARELFGEGIPPAYAIHNRGVYFTHHFAPYDAQTGAGLGPNCRAAMVVHESIHVFDPRSGEPDIHISEWDEPRFSEQTIEEALHNPSAYASLGAQLYTRSMEWPRSARYGAGRPAD